MIQNRESQPIEIGLNAVIVAVTGGSPRVLTLREPSSSTDGGPILPSLPYGRFDPARDSTLELGVRKWVKELTGLDLPYVEQLYTFGDRNRDPAEKSGGPRVISIAYVALVREGILSGKSNAEWRDYYAFFPWEDWRRGKPPLIENSIIPQLQQWAKAFGNRRLQSTREERIAITFGLGPSDWDPEKTLERYELLYEAGLAQEARSDHPELFRTIIPDHVQKAMGKAMALDHRRMLATALGRLRGKIKYRPVVFELVPPTFTLLHLLRVVEALAGIRLHKQNFRRLLEKGGLVEGTGLLDRETGGRPAELFRFRREVLRERRAPGIGLPVS